ncbi:hypothetical protein AK812_SmicGene31633 [Symbiodinium microadriaticum]|uniref:Uncharacterized protein n=1 Tax=Symbiodinium microadriaticum TaxID=2951 RepID=A0A1Q9CW91_SYMMI|nr:hypothetical protein AK812_SmicGene31633 [Symbiodinium microadriaticum]CAE7361345.1 unnamed protein product [Symbiodinium microadriaticum]CAE7555709.1 unnamed protein product [Symbiodinium sp. KB8]
MCLFVWYLTTECIGGSLGTAFGDPAWMIIALMIATAFAAALGMYMYMGVTLRAFSERVQALETQVDSQESELVNLRDKVVHLRQCLIDTSSQASQFAHGEQLQVNAKYDMAREIHGLKHDIKMLERELVKARAATAPPTAVYDTSERGHCYHHESCHHVRNNTNRPVADVRAVLCTRSHYRAGLRPMAIVPFRGSVTPTASRDRGAFAFLSFSAMQLQDRLINFTAQLVALLWLWPAVLAAKSASSIWKDVPGTKLRQG